MAPISIPNVFAGQSPSAISKLDTDFSTIQSYINNREVTIGLIANRPATGNAGAWFVASDVSGGTLYVDNGVAWTTVAAGVSGGIVYTDQLTGLTLSFSSGTVLGIALGAAASQDAAVANRVLMSLLSAFTKTTAAWAVGTGNGGLATGVAIANSTWYHVFLIRRTDTLVVDVAFDTSVTGANIAANTNVNYTKLRRLGSFLTSGAGAIVNFTQVKDYFRWASSVSDLATTNPGIAAVTQTFASVPTGVAVFIVANWRMSLGAASASAVFVSELSATDEAPGANAIPFAHLMVNASEIKGVPISTVLTNTVAQVRYRLSFSDANTGISAATLGWIDRRGQG